MACRGILDTGCEDNWISLEIIERAGMVPSVVQNTFGNILTGFGGGLVESKGSITITWYVNNASKTRQTTFLVAKHGPFDLLLGNKSIFSENIFIFNEAALVLRAAPISDGMYMLPAFTLSLNLL